MLALSGSQQANEEIFRSDDHPRYAALNRREQLPQLPANAPKSLATKPRNDRNYSSAPSVSSFEATATTSEWQARIRMHRSRRILCRVSQWLASHAILSSRLNHQELDNSIDILSHSALGVAPPLSAGHPLISGATVVVSSLA